VTNSANPPVSAEYRKRLLPMLSVPADESFLVGQSQRYREKPAPLLTALDLSYLSASQSSVSAPLLGSAGLLTVS